MDKNINLKLEFCAKTGKPHNYLLHTQEVHSNYDINKRRCIDCKKGKITKAFGVATYRYQLRKEEEKRMVMEQVRSSKTQFERDQEEFGVNIPLTDELRKGLRRGILNPMVAWCLMND